MPDQPSFLSRLWALAWPGGVVLLASVALFRPGVLPVWADTLVTVYAYLVLIVGVALGWVLQHRRLAVAVFLLALVDGTVGYYLVRDALQVGMGRVVYEATALLLPLNLLALSLIPEKTKSAAADLARFGFILVQVPLVWWLALPGQQALAARLHMEWIPPAWMGWTAVPQPAFVVFLLAVAVTTTRFVRARDLTAKGYAWAVVAAAVAVHGSATGWIPTSLLATGGLVLILAYLEHHYQQAYYDRMTGVPGRQAFRQFLFGLGGQYALALADIDRLKELNSEHGIGVGNTVLRMIAKRIATMSGGGKVFRYEGGRFVMVFPGKTAADVLPTVEAMRDHVEKLRFVMRHAPRRHWFWQRWVASPRAAPAAPARRVGVTISVGLAERPDRKATPEQVLKAAEKALVRAKYLGRNQVKCGKTPAAAIG